MPEAADAPAVATVIGGGHNEVLLRGAYIVSTTGDWIYRFALPLLVLQETGSALSTAFTYVLEVVPYILIGLFAGTVADRSDRRRLMIGCDTSAALLVGLLAVLLIVDRPPIWVLYSLALLLGAVRPVYFPAFQGFLVDRVAEPRRPVMNAWVQGTDSTLNMLGPVMGVTVVVLIGPGTACAANAVSFALSAALIWRTPATPQGHQHGQWGEIARNVWADFRVGIHHILGSSALLWGTVLMTITNFAALAVESNLIYIVTDANHAASAALGPVFAAQGAGALLGATIAPALIRRLPVGTTLTAAMALMALALALPALSPHAVLIGIATFLVGVATSAIIVPWFTFRQSIVPGELIGRVASVGRSLSYITIPIGAVVGSWVISTAGNATLFIVAGAAQAAVWLGTMLSPLGKAGHRTPPATTDDEPHPGRAE